MPSLRLIHRTLLVSLAALVAAVPGACSDDPEGPEEEEPDVVTMRIVVAPYL